MEDDKKIRKVLIVNKHREDHAQKSQRVHRTYIALAVATVAAILAASIWVEFVLPLIGADNKPPVQKEKPAAKKEPGQQRKPF